MLVSIIMPTYNCGEYIAQSIESVLYQSIDDWELIIVDDCSTDDTDEIVKSYMDMNPRIKYYKLNCNSGPALARTEAIYHATGKYIAFLDSDDIWAQNKLERQINFMEKNNILFSCTAYACMNEFGKSLGYAMFPPIRTDYKKCIYLSNPIGNLTVMYNQEILGKFEVPMIKKRNDFALWLQILKKAKYCYGLQDVLATYRLGRKGSVSHNKVKQVRYHWQLYHGIEKHGLFRSALEILCWGIVKSTKIGLTKKNIM